MALSSMFCSGSAAHWDPTEALVRTLTEVTQSRIAFISTLRDDVGPKVLHDMRSDYWLTRSAFESWFSHTSFEPFSTIFRSEASHPANGLAALLARMRDSSAISMLVCAPLRTASGLVCYRVYAPELNELHRAWIE
jgi:ribosomal protein S12 methylthiotransferase accessory factor YcaO